MLGSPWGSLSSVGKQMEQTDKRAAQSARKKQTGEEGTDLCFHGNQLLSGVKVPLLHFFLKSLRWKTQTREKEFYNKSLMGIRKTSCLSGLFSTSQQKNNAVVWLPRCHVMPALKLLLLCMGMYSLWCTSTVMQNETNTQLKIKSFDLNVFVEVIGSFNIWHFISNWISNCEI